MSGHLDQAQQLLAAEGLLEGDAAAHLEGCGACRAEVSQLRALNAAAADPAGVSAETSRSDSGPIPWSADPEMEDGQSGGSPSLGRGALVGRYEVLSELGQGGMGVVYAANDRELARKVAVKVLKPGRSRDGQTRLLREAQAMARVSHPNVLPVFDVGTVGDQVFVAMEFVEGGTLRTWLKARPHWREVLQRFLAAGRGLAAAHRAGLVHRDFKPDNVLVSDDGRVFVTDFGLARLVSDRTEEATETSSPPESATVLSEQLTRAGVVMGTPAYMAPEQHLGLAADARSDQFSFAAALYGGLWRQRPFDPQRLAAAAALLADDESGLDTSMRRRLASEVVQPPPPEPKVPAWLREAVLRALALRPEDRFPSLEAMLALIEGRLAANRRGVFAAAAGATLLAGAVALVGVTELKARAERCSGAETALAGAWDAGRRTRLHQAFANTALPEAATLAERASAILDRYAEQWTAMHREACEATRIREVQPEAVLALRMSCLDRRRLELRSLGDLLAAADPAIARGAVDAALQLPAISACGDVSALTGRTPPPEDPALRARIDALTSVLAEANALRYASRFADAASRLEPQLEEARALGYRPLEAEVLYTHGLAMQRSGRAEAGTRAVSDAFFAADAGRDDLLRAQAALRLLYIASQQSNPEGMTQWERAARIAIERMGGHRELEADLLSMVGRQQLAKGQVEEGMASLRRGLELITAELGADSGKRIGHLNNLASGLLQLGKLEEGLSLLEEAVRLGETIRGPTHSSLAAPLNQLAKVYTELRRFPEAHEAVDRSLAVIRLRYGEAHPWVGDSLDRKATVFQTEGRLAEALETYRAALEAKKKVLPPKSPILSYSLDGIGQCLAALGRTEEALGPLEEALALRDEEPLGLAESRFALAKTLGSLGRSPGRVRTLLAQAEADYARAGRPDKSTEVAQYAARGR